LIHPSVIPSSKSSVEPSVEPVQLSSEPSSLPSAVPSSQLIVDRSSSSSSTASREIPSFMIPIIVVVAFLIVAFILLWYRRHRLLKEKMKHAGKIDRWMASQSGDVVIRVQNEQDMRVEESYNPAFDVNKLPASKQAEAQAKIDLAASKSERTTEIGLIRTTFTQKSAMSQTGYVSVDP